MVGDDAEVRRERQLETAAEGVALHDGDHRLQQPRKAIEDRVTEHRP